MAEGDAMVFGMPFIIGSGILALSTYIILDKYLKDVFTKLDTSTTLLILFLTGLPCLAIFAIFIKILSEIDDC
jgi:peptidoglycan biosynthesis protein MviN/MurJ (putative lipid II flippase)